MPFDPISLGLSGVGLISNIIGASNAARQRQHAEAQRRQLLLDMSTQNDQQYNDLRNNNSLSLRQATGQLNDGLQSQGRALGSSMAGAGVYNSSATSGALEQQAGANAAALASFAGQGFQSEQALNNQNKQNLNNTKLGFAQQDEQRARGNESGAYSGLGGSLTDLLGQFSPRNNGAAMNGNQGSRLSLPGQTGVGGPLGGSGNTMFMPATFPSLGVGTMNGLNPRSTQGMFPRLYGGSLGG
jgi:hypothetical protein